MKEGQILWTRNELILAFNLYVKTPFGRLHGTNPDVIALAKLIGRTPGSVAYKLVNFASLDPRLQARGIKGATNASNLDKAIWNEFYQNWTDKLYESEALLAEQEKRPIADMIPLEDMALKEGKEKERLIKVRVNQYLFRAAILASYDSTCCITGIKNPDLLVASHIAPWSTEIKNRMNPQNGLCLNALHDRAFDKYLITVTPDYTIKLSRKIKNEAKTQSVKENFIRFEGEKITLPQKFMPDEKFLVLHNEMFEKLN
jgi:putative restriction endonuclease